MISVTINHNNSPILLVDDNPADRALFAQQIRKGLNKPDDIDIVEAGSCAAAVEALKTVSPCCCLVDYHLPDANGLELLAKIRQAEEGKDIPFIAMTGDGDEKIAVQLMRNGAQDYLSKNEITDELLVRSINNAIHTSDLQSKIRHLAHYDSLTGLLNRALLMDRIQAAIERCDRYQHSSSVLYIDVDNFKRVNDDYGHEAGDFLLKTVGKRIATHCRTSDSAARLGGDEFVILLEHIDQQNTTQTAEKILRAVSTPVSFDGKPFEISLSIGIAHYPHTASNAQQLLRQADEAMYRAKSDGKGQYSQFTLKQKKAWERQNRLEKALPRAIENGDLSLVYQPVISVADNNLHSFNVNVRWNFEDFTVPASEVVTMVSRFGLADSFHVWLIDTAFRQLHCWQQQHEGLQVNLSVLANRCNDQLLSSILHKASVDYGISASRLQLLLTEKVLLTHPVETGKMINALHAQGAQVAINNFGADYSSIAHLSTLPIDALFVDQQFFAGIHLNRRKRIFVEALLSMTKKLGLQMTAKGIEGQAQAAVAAGVGCDYMLGYYFGRPHAYAENWYRFVEYFPTLNELSSTKNINQLS